VHVILAAGAIETPLILERSGAGRPDVLSRAGIDLRVESPNVGERVIEQHGAAIQVRFKREIGYTLQLSSKMKQLAQGPATCSPARARSPRGATT
jgi:choline dehydrogenase-like flavoprotein